MSDFVMAGAGVALLSLIFSDYPFVQLVYFLAITNVVDWDQWGIVTGIMVLAMLGINMYKRLK